MWAKIISIAVLVGKKAVVLSSDALVPDAGSSTGYCQAVGGITPNIIERTTPAVTVVLSGSSNSAEDVRARASKEADLAIAQTDTRFFAAQGRAAFQGCPQYVLGVSVALHPERGLATCDSLLGFLLLPLLPTGAAFSGLVVSDGFRRMLLRATPRAASPLGGSQGSHLPLPVPVRLRPASGVPASRGVGGASIWRTVHDSEELAVLPPRPRILRRM